MVLCGGQKVSDPLLGSTNLEFMKTPGKCRVFLSMCKSAAALFIITIAALELPVLSLYILYLPETFW